MADRISLSGGRAVPAGASPAGGGAAAPEKLAVEREKVGLYLRLSREDGEAESQSIASQREYLLRYVEEKGWMVREIYVDDGYSGTNFDRPGFQRMMRDVEEGSIDTILTKDLSRLGRDYVEVGYYLERYFPLNRVRFLAVSDGIDTENPDGSDRFAPFLSVFNDMYAKDISRKVRTALTARKYAGRFIGASPPFGYQRGENGTLVPKPEEARVVELLFQIYLKSGSLRGTARQMTEQGIPSPSSWRGSLETAQWNESTVRRILTNPTYAGHLTQNRSTKLNCKLRKKRALPPEQWIIVRNTHLPLVTEEVFFQVQDSIERRGRNGNVRQNHLLSGFAFCADCGAPMAFVKENGGRSVLVCRNYRKHGREACSPHRIWEQEAEQEVERGLREALTACGLENQVLLPQEYLEKVTIGEDRSLSVFYLFQKPKGI